MKEKLFIWAYTGTIGSIQTCLLTASGKMLSTIFSEVDSSQPPRSEVHQNQHKENIRLFIAGNETLAEEYNIVVVPQEKLEKHMYDGEDRNTYVPEDFRIAWDKYKMGEAIAN